MQFVVFGMFGKSQHLEELEPKSVRGFVLNRRLKRLIGSADSCLN